MNKKIGLGLLIILLGIQLIRPEKNTGPADTPMDITHAMVVPDNVRHLLKTSCYDCHSNHTAYPWYTNINPVGWWMNQHVVEGKDELNFSEFARYNPKKADRKLKEIAEQVQEHEMPLSSYTLIHTDAELNPEQIKLITDWVKTSRAAASIPSQKIQIK